MVDVESSTQQSSSGSSVSNPYSSSDSVQPIFTRWHPLNVLRRCVYMFLGLYGMNYFDTYHKLMNDPNISHEWFKIGLGASIAFLFIKSYVEMYAGKLQKKQISYKTFPQTTHTVLVLLIASSIAFHKALWPVYHSASLLIMFLLGVFLLNFCLLFPTYIQNIAAFAILTFFLQEYK